MVQLLSPLVPGQTYYTSFFANAAWGGTALYPIARLASSNVGIRFTTQPSLWVPGSPLSLPVNYASVYYPQILADTVGWTLVSGNFVADSSYHYLMIGNHFENSLTDTLPIGESINPPISYTFIDNVCVTSNPSGCPLVNGVQIEERADFSFFPNPARNSVELSGIKNECRIDVYDVYGHKLWEDFITDEIWQLDVGSWARGSYMLRITELDRINTLKFVLID